MGKRKTKFEIAMIAGCMAAIMSMDLSAAASEHLDENVAFASVSGKYLNIRSESEKSSEVVGIIENNGYMEIIDEDDPDWYHVKSGDIEGYVSADYVVTGSEADKVAETAIRKCAEVDASTLNIRSKPSTDAPVIKKVSRNTKLTVAQNLGAWVKIKLDDGSYGYVSSDYVNLKTDRKEASGRGMAIVNYACQFIGNPYVWGGTSLTGGADCSGFVMSVFAHFGIGLPRVTYTQVGCGRAVSISELEPGDLVFYYPGVEHVAIYCGGGMVVHAANSRIGIVKTSLYYNGTPVACRRIV